MTDQEPKRGVPGKTDLTQKEWRFLNLFSEPDSPLWGKQLEKIDELRNKYPEGSPAQEALNIFDPRTGVAERTEVMFNEALRLSREGDIQGAEEVMRKLSELGNNP